MVMMIRWIALVVASLVLPGGAWAQEESPVDAAVEAATEWLSLVDEGLYAESWAQSDSAFKAAVGEDQWFEMLTTVRKPLGEVVSRVPRSAAFAAALPEAPPGPYVVIEFNTAFTHDSTATERVTPRRTEHGWRVSGYFIR